MLLIAMLEVISTITGLILCKTKVMLTIWGSLIHRGNDERDDKSDDAGDESDDDADK